MLPKLTILMLLATMVPECLSGPTNATSSLLPKDPDRLKALEAALPELGISTSAFETMVENTPNKLAKSNYEFHSKFLQTVIARENKRDPENIVFSAFSIHSVLMAIYLATEPGSDSHKELAKALFLERSESDVTYLVNYYQVMSIYQRDPYLKVANAFFVRSDFPVHPYFKNLLFGIFGARPQELNMLTGEVQINEFVEEETDGWIKGLMPPRSIRQGTETVVLNTLLHEGDWVFGFKPELTGPMDWNLPDGTTFQYLYGMKMKSDEIRYARFYEYTVVEFLYQGTDDIKMFAVLPNKNNLNELNSLTRFFDREEVEGSLEKNPLGVCILFPRLELSDHIDLVDIMKHMGVKKVFNNAEANLQVMTPELASVTQALTKVTVNINEKGSQSSAGSAAATCTRSGPDEILFNKPFSIIIMNTDTGNILFTARVVKPTGGAKPSALPIAYPTKPQ